MSPDTKKAKKKRTDPAKSTSAARARREAEKEILRLQRWKQEMQEEDDEDKHIVEEETDTGARNDASKRLVRRAQREAENERATIENEATVEQQGLLESEKKERDELLQEETPLANIARQVAKPGRPQRLPSSTSDTTESDSETFGTEGAETGSEDTDSADSDETEDYSTDSSISEESTRKHKDKDKKRRERKRKAKKEKAKKKRGSSRLEEAILRTAEVTRDESFLADHKVSSIMKKTYGTARKPFLKEDIARLIGGHGETMDEGVRQATRAAVERMPRYDRHRLADEIRKAVAKKGGVVPKKIKLDAGWYTKVEEIAKAYLMAEVRQWTTSREETYAEEGYQARMNTLAKHWGLKKVPRQPTSSQGQGQKTPKTCYSCGKVGHLSAQCRSKQRQTGTRACYRCGSKDHVVAQCSVSPLVKCEKCGREGHTVTSCRKR